MKIDKAIESSKAMLDLREDWDDEGARQIKQETWDRMKALLTELNEVCAKHNCSELFSTASISPCANGSIDIWWPGLLLNVRTEPK